MVDGEELKEEKDIIFDEFMRGVKEINKGRVPKSFESTTYFLGCASKYFPKSKQREINTIIEVANEQLPYVQALELVKITRPEHKKREKRLNKFLQKYNSSDKKYFK